MRQSEESAQYADIRKQQPPEAKPNFGRSKRAGGRGKGKGKVARSRAPPSEGSSIHTEAADVNHGPSNNVVTPPRDGDHKSSQRGVRRVHSE
ncbi:hypothetical protein R1flu_023846 [Riccia fluitans]|uniref:Uncharacterized protein n=1 Tax=Riccia fluitans TaxID=41844 RepID=A0ABD1XT67_9MARC